MTTRASSLQPLAAVKLLRATTQVAVGGVSEQGAAHLSKEADMILIKQYDISIVQQLQVIMSTQQTRQLSIQ
jgi:hypothetical protein